MLRRFFSRTVNPNGLRSHYLSVIRSGAQTGVDRGALDAALYLSMPICGWVPMNLLAREPIPSRYFPMLKEMTPTDFPELRGLTDERNIYCIRTEQNAKEADATLVVIQKPSEYCGGTSYTTEMAIKHSKPYFIYDLSRQMTVENLVDWIVTHRIRDLNIGGPNEQKSPGVYQVTFDLTTELLLHPKLNKNNALSLPDIKDQLSLSL